MSKSTLKIADLALANNVVLAPMAGISDLPYRLIMKSFGAGLVFTEMVSANGLIRDGRRTLVLLASDPAERPLGLQLFGDDPAILAEAAAMLEGKGELLDLNLGCPVPKVVRSGAGSALLRDPLRVGRIVAAVRRVWTGPLTVKIRSGWDDASLNYVAIAQTAVAAGADAITLHPRTRAQGFSGQAAWEHIRRLRAAVTVPVIGSGDIFTAEDALAMQRQTGCDGVMIGRGGYGNPWLIRNIIRLQNGREQALPTPTERLETALRHLTLVTAASGERHAVLEMRKHLCWYARGLTGAATFRSTVNRSETLQGLRELLTHFFLHTAETDESRDETTPHAT
ncbi:MAG: tRNA dihydrouridine synthase DusB [Desulfuromonadales bacterium GWD2_61_12]|nr:MAG: tRNA dihydrouridine synthase DusB [Desulfuromonadales bacterium GWC2_61_20]OGR34142.1 MAG: tRNA dihydrouridine synthase DusB [Desulfuromonadales bacterium GWD2_61_12]HAD03458.1 tRNA dihydrouridine synthase DusB [Desulfuromonas sp.]HBT83452.1 tRNA dihydrouridine synthase DusB [Desulfuromonas sp.]